MFLAKDSATEVLCFIIQYADDIDVGELLKIFDINLVYREPKDYIQDEFLMSNKEILLLKMCEATRGYYNYSNYITPDRIKAENNKIKLIIAHLKIIAECINSLYVELKQKSENQISENSLGLIINNETVSIEDYKHKHNLLREINKKILHLIINCYSEHKFYYILGKDSIKKITFNNAKNKTKANTTDYNLLSAKRTSYIINENTGLKINIGIPIRFYGFKQGSDSKEQNKDIKNFEKLNNAIISALNKEPKPCHWCYPDKNNNPRKYVCDNCQEILLLLNNMQKEKKDKHSIIQVEKELRKFNYKQYANAMTLRKRRKQYLEYIAMDCKEKLDISQPLTILLIKLINKGFGAIE